MISLYIHIPFCNRKCEYCSFHVMEAGSLREKNKLVEAYVNALIVEIETGAYSLPRYNRRNSPEGIETLPKESGLLETIAGNSRLKQLQSTVDSFHTGNAKGDCHVAEKLLAMTKSPSPLYSVENDPAESGGPEHGSAENDGVEHDGTGNRGTLGKPPCPPSLTSPPPLSKGETKTEVRTIYIGGGTPLMVGVDNLVRIIDTIGQCFSLEYLAELTIECNPDPFDEVLEMVRALNQRYAHFLRLRFSVGIQSFDDEILQASGRNYSFNGLVGFLRDLQALKQANNCFNLDFIAFGKFQTLKNSEKQLRDPQKLEFFERLMQSHFADSVSLYTLELFPGAKWYYKEMAKGKGNHSLVGVGRNKDSTDFSPWKVSGRKIAWQEEERRNEKGGVFDVKLGPYSEVFGSDDEVYDEFSLLKEIIIEAGYKRYEISNFCLAGMSSIHNRVYREMDDYLGFGTSAASFVKNLSPPSPPLEKRGEVGELTAFRWSNTKVIGEYLKGKYVDEGSVVEMSDKDFLIEEFFLSLRTDKGVENVQKFASVLVDDWEERIADLVEQGFVRLKNGKGCMNTGSSGVLTKDLLEDSSSKSSSEGQRRKSGDSSSKSSSEGQRRKSGDSSSKSSSEGQFKKSSEGGLVGDNPFALRLTDQGLDVYNEIVTSLLNDI